MAQTQQRIIPIYASNGDAEAFLRHDVLHQIEDALVVVDQENASGQLRGCRR